jgi:RNA-binding protein YhbY
MVKLVGNRFTSHRKISEREKEVIEDYLKREVFKEDDVTLVYNGVNQTLIKEYNKMYAPEPTSKPTTMNAAKAREAQKAVNEVINKAMEAYYFEKIGDFLIQYRDMEAGPEKGTVLMGLYEMVQAYNKYVPKEKRINNLKQILKRKTK